jgi:polysaccharide biosynthesis transport protein
MSDLVFTVDTGAMRYIDALRRHWVLIAMLCVLAVAAAAVSTYTATKRYTTTADLSIRPLSTNDTTFLGFASLLQQAPDGSLPVVTAARLVNSPTIRNPCQQSLPRSARNAKISINPLSQADVLEIKADGPSPKGVAAAANGFASCVISNRNQAFKAELAGRISQLRARVNAFPQGSRQGNFEYAALAQQLAGFTAALGTPNPTLARLSDAGVPRSPVWPRPKIALAASLLVALLLGVGIALLLEFVTPRIGNEDDLRIRQRLPILARIPRLSRSAARAYITGKAPLPPQAWKSYRVLRAVLANSGRAGGYPRSIMMTSAMPGDGKTTSAINLALTLARSDLHVVLIDADVHRPMVATFFNVAASRNGFGRLSAGTTSARCSSTPRSTRT